MTKVWRQSVNRYWRYRGNIKLPRESRTDGRTHGQRHGQTTRKHIASAGAYRRRRLKIISSLFDDSVGIRRRSHSNSYIRFAETLIGCNRCTFGKRLCSAAEQCSYLRSVFVVSVHFVSFIHQITVANNKKELKDETICLS